jgi:hypothetical protein
MVYGLELKGTPSAGKCRGEPAKNPAANKSYRTAAQKPSPFLKALPAAVVQVWLAARISITGSKYFLLNLLGNLGVLF